MIQYLRQRQLEKLWCDGNPAEGVILKRGKNDFVCQPQELSGQLYGFYDEIRKLNVKVSLFLLACRQTILTSVGCNDDQDCRYPNLPP